MIAGRILPSDTLANSCLPRPVYIVCEMPVDEDQQCQWVKYASKYVVPTQALIPGPLRLWPRRSICLAVTFDLFSCDQYRYSLHSVSLWPEIDNSFGLLYSYFFFSFLFFLYFPSFFFFTMRLLILYIPCHWYCKILEFLMCKKSPYTQHGNLILGFQVPLITQYVLYYSQGVFSMNRKYGGLRYLDSLLCFLLLIFFMYYIVLHMFVN